MPQADTGQVDFDLCAQLLNVVVNLVQVNLLSACLSNVEHF